MGNTVIPVMLFSCSAVSDSVTSRTVARQAPWSMDFLAGNAGVGCYFFFQVIFLSQGLSPSILNWQAGSLSLSHEGSPVPLILHIKT